MDHSQDILLITKLVNKLKYNGYDKKELVALIHSIYVCLLLYFFLQTTNLFIEW